MIRNPERVIELLYEVFDDILFSWDITLNYDNSLRAIVIIIDDKIHGFIECENYPEWSLWTKNYTLYKYIDIKSLYQTENYKYLLLSFINKCIERVKTEEALCL